jgi:CubicO group peptidase (beta-lactamase class C family)
LVEKNKINFTDTLGKILINYPNKNAVDKITVHQLLTHTTGIADPFELGRRKPGVDYSTAQSNLSLFADTPLKMEPGTHHSYSNGNYAVLALIVEKVSGLSFEEYINKNIFVPAGMEIASKQFYKDLPLAVRYSHSAENDPLGIRPLTPVSDPANDIQFEYSGFSNGYMTAKDVYKFLFALKSGMLISNKMLEVITRGKVEVEAGAPIKYAYGFYDANIWGANFRGHSGGGGNSGIGADAEMLWNNDYYIVVLGNCDLDKVRPIEFSIIRFLSSQN